MKNSKGKHVVVSSIKRIGIIANSTKENAAEYSLKLEEWLKIKGVDVELDEEIALKTGRGPGVKRESLASRADMIVVFGGDGTLLMAGRYAAANDVPIVGINLGGFGFMTVINLGEMYDAMELIIKGDYSTSERMMLDASINGTKFTALNDIVINRGTLSRMVNMETFVDDKYLTTFKADGLIISTPTGSTAYSLSAGGPIVFPELKSIIINPICPHTLTNRPIMLPPDSVIKVALITDEKGASITVDGQVLRMLKGQQTVTIKRSFHHIDLVNSPFNDYLEIIRTKLGWGGQRTTC